MSKQVWVLLVVDCEAEEVIDVCDLAEMRADGIQEQQLQVDVPFNQVKPGPMDVAVQQVNVLYASEVMQTLLDDISVDHLLISIAHFVNLVLDLVLKDGVEVLHIGVFGLPSAVGRALFQCFG